MGQRIIVPIMLFRGLVGLTAVLALCYADILDSVIIILVLGLIEIIAESSHRVSVTKLIRKEQQLAREKELQQREERLRAMQGSASSKYFDLVD